MENPFTPGSGTKPPYLAGRENHLSRFKQMLKDIEDDKQSNLVLLGLRGTGKTVLIHKFEEICLKQGFFPIVKKNFSEKHCDPDEFFLSFKDDFKTSMESLSLWKSLAGKLIAVANFLKPKKIGFEGTFIEPSYTKSKTPLENAIAKTLSKNWAFFNKLSIKGVIFLFDEFQNIRNKNKRTVLTDFIGALNEAQNNNLKYFVVFSGLPNLHLNLFNARTYSFRIFSVLNVGDLSKEEATEAIKIPLKKSKYSFSKDLLNTLVEETGQYPYFIQLYCKEIITRTNKLKIKLSDYRKIKPQIMKQLDQDYFDPTVAILPDGEKDVLISMAKIRGVDIPSKEIDKKATSSRSAISKSLTRLQQRGLVYNYKRGVYRFSLPLFRDYLVRISK